MTPTSETPAAAAARRELMRERQARVGILRNPNTPPRPPQRKARLMGKWPGLQSTRRLQAQTSPDIAPGVTDTDLARMMKEVLVPPTPDVAHEPFARPTVVDDAVPPTANNALPANEKARNRPPARTLKPLVLIGSCVALIAMALIATAS